MWFSRHILPNSLSKVLIEVHHNAHLASSRKASSCDHPSEGILPVRQPGIGCYSPFDLRIRRLGIKLLKNHIIIENFSNIDA